MFKKTKQKAADLARELAREIRMMEGELAQKKELLAVLTGFERPIPLRGRRP